MREIKFRGKRTENMMWIEGGYVEWVDIHGHRMFHIISRNGYHNDVIPETVGQFTGLLDKNGKEVYEGDVIKVEHNKDKNKCRDIFIATGDVFWNNESMCLSVGGSILCTLCTADTWYNIEVIGNIYDNPELIHTVK